MACIGGSIGAMANSLMEGHVLLTRTTLKRLTLDELRNLLFEIEKLLREKRAVVPDQSDNIALKKRNQQVLKLSNIRLVINNTLRLKIKGRL